MTHLMCCKCHAAGAQAVPMLAGALREAVGDVVGCGLTHGAWEQATIPISKGGLGVRDTEHCWAEARVAAIVGFHAKASKLVGLPATIASSPVPETPQVLAHLSGTLGPHHDPISQWVLSPSSLATAHLSCQASLVGGAGGRGTEGALATAGDGPGPRTPGQPRRPLHRRGSQPFPSGP